MQAANPPHLIFEAPESLQPIVKRLNNMGWPHYSYAMKLAGLDYPGPAILVYVVPETSQLGAQLPPWVSGFANGEASTIVLLAERVHSYPARAIEDLLVHEVAHILNHRAARGREIPRWFDEGIATIAARTWDIEDRARLLWAVGERDEFSLERVNMFFRGNAPTARRGYALSAGFVRDIIQEYGQDTPRRILALVAQDVPFPIAFRQVVSLLPHQAAEAFIDRQSVWLRWVPFVTSDFMIWIGISTLAFVAFGMHVRRLKIRRRQQAEEEDQDNLMFDYGELEQPTESEWGDSDKWRDR
tara:strand:+ start:534 stop:1433 length:900 start_codon:yes stop_codon:yes gene_type:complete